MRHTRQEVETGAYRAYPKGSVGNKEVSMRLAAIVFLITLISASSAQAARFSLVGVANSSEPNEPGTEYSGRPGYGAGLLVEFRIMPAIGFEMGALYMPRKYEYNTAVPTSTKTTLSGKMYEFPVLLRMHLGRLFSLGVGGYYAKAAGQISGETQTEGAGTTTQVYTYAARNQTETDYGALVSLALYMRMAPLTYFTVDGRYAMGMKNTSTIAGSERKYNDMQLLAGLQFGF